MTPAPLLLPGQVAAPEGPADMTMMYVLHHAFRRDVRDFTRAAAATATGDSARWALLAERWRHFTYELHQHHARRTRSSGRCCATVSVRPAMPRPSASCRRWRPSTPSSIRCSPPRRPSSSGSRTRATSAPTTCCATCSRSSARCWGTTWATRSRRPSRSCSGTSAVTSGRSWSARASVRSRASRRPASSCRGLSRACRRYAEHRVLNLSGPPLRVVHALSRRRFAAQEAEVFGPATA